MSPIYYIVLQVRVKAAYNNFIHEIELRGKKRKGKIVMIEKVLKITIWGLPWSHTVVMYGCESWTIKKAERWRIDAFELWC